MKLYRGQFALVPLTPDSQVLVPILPRGLGPWSPLSCLVLFWCRIRPIYDETCTSDFGLRLHIRRHSRLLSYSVRIGQRRRRYQRTDASSGYSIHLDCVENFERMSHCGEVYGDRYPSSSDWGLRRSVVGSPNGV